MALELPSARDAADLLTSPGRSARLFRDPTPRVGWQMARLFQEAAGSETPSMKHQIIAGAGLAAVIAFCSYMIVQLDAHRSQRPGMAIPASIGGR